MILPVIMIHIWFHVPRLILPMNMFHIWFYLSPWSVFVCTSPWSVSFFPSVTIIHSLSWSATSSCRHDPNFLLLLPGHFWLYKSPRSSFDSFRHCGLHFILPVNMAHICFYTWVTVASIYHCGLVLGQFLARIHVCLPCHHDPLASACHGPHLTPPVVIIHFCFCLSWSAFDATCHNYPHLLLPVMVRILFYLS